MKFFEITINTMSEATDLVSSLIWDVTDLGVSICDNSDIVELIECRHSTFDYIDDSLIKNLDSKTAKVKCYFNLDENDKIAKLYESLLEMKEASSSFCDFGTLEMTKREIEGDDWIDVWRKHYKPIIFDKVVICPEWIQYDKTDKPVIKINGNLAFGTGEHETTAMCINHMGNYIHGGETVIDVGTGSGILGIGAALLGAGKVVMTDIDPVAVEVARYNIKLNGAEEKCYAYEDNLLDKNNLVGDVILANLTAEILYFLADSICTYCHKGSVIILSGILNDRVQKVSDCFKKIGFSEEKRESQGEWSSLVMVKE